MFRKNGDSGDSDVLGNNEPKHRRTTRENQSKLYVFTKFPKDGDLETDFQDSLKSICEEFQYSHEICPNTQKLHYQGQMVLRQRMRKSQIVKYKHLNMFLDYQKGTQSQNNSYILKNTDNYIKWVKEVKDERNTIKAELENVSEEDLNSLLANLINKRFNDPNDRQRESYIYPCILESHEKYGFTIDHRWWLISLCTSHILALQSLKRSNSILNKYLN